MRIDTKLTFNKLVGHVEATVSATITTATSCDKCIKHAQTATSAFVDATWIWSTLGANSWPQCEPIRSVPIRSDPARPYKADNGGAVSDSIWPFDRYFKYIYLLFASVAHCWRIWRIISASCRDASPYNSCIWCWRPYTFHKTDITFQAIVSCPFMGET